MPQDFLLYEALLWEPGPGYFLLDRHLRRLARSALHFGFDVEAERVRKQLEEFATTLPGRARKVRLEIARDGATRLEDVDVKPSTPVQVALAHEPVDGSDEFLGHKTSRRGVYQRALAAHPEAQDVLLWNERGELTESCASNLVLEIAGRRLTPDASCGLLPGTFREQLLEHGEIEAKALPKDALERATRMFLINSVRRWYEFRLLPR